MTGALAAALRAGACLALCAVPASAAPVRVESPARFDGIWNVEIVTEEGMCDRSYRYPVTIANGRARFVGASFTVRGQVSRNGAIRGSISNGTATANVVGRLGANGIGRGTWAGGGLFECRGRWNAARRS